MEALSGQVSEDEKSTMCKWMFGSAEIPTHYTEHYSDTVVSEAASFTGSQEERKETIESWDIAGAFFKGFDFKSIQKALQKMGLTAPTTRSSWSASKCCPQHYW